MSEMYTAIDLGTTNSVIAYANIVRDKMKPVVLNLERKNDTGSTSRAPLLLSFIIRIRKARLSPMSAIMRRVDTGREPDMCASL